jgi:choline dehydrogenase-like flavoprotein
LANPERADVLVIGSGASGAAVAWRLSEAGMKVVCLEQGRWVDPASYATADPQWEIRRQREFSPNPNIRRSPEDYPVEDSKSAIKPLMFNGVGGSTIMWSSHAPRFHPSDFRVRSLDGVADDWPLTYEELEPYYDLNDRMTGMSGLAGDPANPPRSPRQTPPVPLGRGGELIAAAFDRLNWHWWPSDVNINTRPYGEGRGACNHCGPCEMGCVHKAKNSTDVTYWPPALRQGVRLITHARVFEITLDEQGWADGALYYDLEGSIRKQNARVVILACNGIGTSRLLLLSKSNRFPDGLANSSGMVGKNLMLHPIALVTGVFDELLEGYKGITACSILCQEFYETDTQRGFVRGFELQVLRSHGPLISALGGFGFPVKWGEGHHRRFAEVFGHTAALAVTSEDMPDERNQVVLDESLKDSSGIPSPKMIYQADDNALKILDFGIARSKEALNEAGAKETMTVPLMSAAGFHLMGTARMGDDPKRFVTNRWGQTHDVANLFIVDGSLFVTAAAVNPTPTIQALALRTADHIIKNRRNL